LDAPLARVVRTVAQRERTNCLVASFQPRDGQSQLALLLFLYFRKYLVDGKEASFIID